MCYNIYINKGTKEVKKMETPRIFITGDTHSDIDVYKLSSKRWKEQKKLTRNDIVIIAGDFGCPWYEGEDQTDKYWLKWHENKNYTTVFVDGNHDNHVALAKYPESVFYGAKCHMIRPHVIHIMRGEVMNIKGHKIWCMGGAESHDKEYRKEGVSWWPTEIPSNEEMEYGIKTFIQAEPDIIISHDCPISAYTQMEHSPDRTITKVNQYFENIVAVAKENNIQWKNWFFGHHHTDTTVYSATGQEMRCVFNDIVEIK